MAERVQADLELMLNELEQMQRVNLLSSQETKSVIKKRKKYEYKLQKQDKIKEDFLCYIQYESSLLDLIELRRDKIGYLHKKREIDGSIAKRINSLFRICEHRFGSNDAKVWITHLKFCQRMDWKVEAGKVLKRFLQAQGHLESSWIFAAKFQTDSGQIGLARTCLLEGLRFHPNSMEIYRSYFMLELEFLKKLPQNEANEEIAEGKLIETVFESLLKVIQEPLFIAELLNLLQKCKLDKVLHNLKAILSKNYTSFENFAVLAILELTRNDNLNKIEKIQNCGKILLEALETLQSEESLEKSLEMVQEMGQKYPEVEENCEILAFELLQKGQILILCNEKHLKILNKFN